MFFVRNGAVVWQTCMIVAHIAHFGYKRDMSGGSGLKAVCSVSWVVHCIKKINHPGVSMQQSGNINL